MIINPIFTLKTYTVENLELNILIANQNITRFDKLIIEESNKGKHLIRYYCMFSKIDEITNILNEAHT